MRDLEYFNRMNIDDINISILIIIMALSITDYLLSILLSILFIYLTTTTFKVSLTIDIKEASYNADN